MNKKQKSTHLDAVKSAFLLSGMMALDQHIAGKKSLIWSRLDKDNHARKVSKSFEELFMKHLDEMSHSDYLHVAEKSGDSHNTFIEKASAHFSKIVDKHGSALNSQVLVSEMNKLDKLHSKHI